MRWLWRMATAGLASEGRWLFPVVLCASLALGSLLPVQGVLDAGRRGNLAYLRRTLGGDLRLNLSLAWGEVAAEDLAAALAALPEGAEVCRGREILTALGEATVRVLVVEGPYPFYGGELWSRPPDEALAAGAAVSANLAGSQALAEGDGVRLLGRHFPVTAVFPESSLTPGALEADGTVVVRAAGLDPVPGREFVLVRLPAMEPAAVAALEADLVARLGRSVVAGPADLAPVLMLGLERLATVYFWSSVIILFMCAFGIAFGVEDYVRSRAPRDAVLRTLGAGPGLVLGLTVFRLALAGLAAGGLGLAWGWLLRALTLALAGARAREMVELSAPSYLPWSFAWLGPALVLAYGAWPLALTFRAKPSLSLRGKGAGFLAAAERRGDAWLSLASVVAVTVVAVPVLGGVFVRGVFYDLAVAWLVLGFGGILLAAVAAATAGVAALGKVVPLGLRWPLTYFRLGWQRAVTAMTAVALALGVGSGAMLLERALTWELQAAIARQVPVSVIAGFPPGKVPEGSLEAAPAWLEEQPGVEAVSVGGADLTRAVYVNRRPVSRLRNVPVKQIDPGQAALYNSTLTPEAARLAGPGSIPCTVWEEVAERWGLAVGDRVEVIGPSGDLVALQVVGLDPYSGLRVGVTAPVSIPRGAWEPGYGFAVARSDPARSGALVRELQERFPGVLAWDLGGLLLVLRAAVADLGFLWWATAAFSLLVSLALYFTMSSIAQIRRTSELALFRALGASRWQLRIGSLAEAAVQALVCGLAGGGLGQGLILRAANSFAAARVPFDRAILAGAVAVALVLGLATQLWSFARGVARPAMQVLRNE